MMPLGMEKCILLSTPKKVILWGKTFDIAVEKSRFADVEKLLKIRPIVVTLNVFGDKDRGRGHTPTNFFNRCYADKDRDMYLEHIMRMAANLSVNVHVARSDKIDYEDLINSAVAEYLKWYMWTLRDWVEVIGQHSGINDLTNLERGIARKQFTIPIQYQFNLPLIKVDSMEMVGGTINLNDGEDQPFFISDMRFNQYK